jgi:hypothetical protein
MRYLGPCNLCVCVCVCVCVCKYYNILFRRATRYLGPCSVANVLLMCCKCVANVLLMKSKPLSGSVQLVCVCLCVSVCDCVCVRVCLCVCMNNFITYDSEEQRNISNTCYNIISNNATITRCVAFKQISYYHIH